MSNHVCPVCGYDQLTRPPKNCLICPSCGTEFDIDDVLHTVAILRDRWLRSGEDGPHWYSKVDPPPEPWDWRAQLRRVRTPSELPLG